MNKAKTAAKKQEEAVYGNIRIKKHHHTVAKRLSVKLKISIQDLVGEYIEHLEKKHKHFLNSFN